MKKLLTIISISLFTVTAFSQTPQGFNYQAVARASDGSLIAEEELMVRLSIQLVDEIFWSEEHHVTTNELGQFALIIGDEDAERIEGSAASFDEIAWEAGNLQLGVKIDDGSGLVDLGMTPLMSVPYALYALSGPAPESNWNREDETLITTNFVVVQSNAAQEDTPLFEVRNDHGNPVFAVYNEGVVVYVDENYSKGVKGGFAVGGYNTATKQLSHEYLKVTPDSTRIYIPDEIVVKGTKGGFAVGGYNTASKQEGPEYFAVTPVASTFSGHLNVDGDISAETITEMGVKSVQSQQIVSMKSKHNAALVRSTEPDDKIELLMDIIMDQQQQIDELKKMVLSEMLMEDN